MAASIWIGPTRRRRGRAAPEGRVTIATAGGLLGQRRHLLHVLRDVTTMGAEGPRIEHPAATAADALAFAIERAAAGDEQAFARIVAAHHDDLTRVAYVICRDQDLTADAVQQAWSIAWRQLPKLREPERLRSWLVAIAANEARQIMRRDRRRNVVELEMAGEASEARGSADWSANVDLRNALALLSPDDRALLALRYVAGLDSFELSRVTRLSPSGTRARLARLLTTLRTELQDG